MNSTIIKIIIFICLLIIYLLVSDNILERFIVSTCPTITLPSPTLVINSESIFSDMREFMNRSNIINDAKSKNLANVNKNFGCVHSNYVGRITK
jgi:hypothetical protein